MPTAIRDQHVLVIGGGRHLGAHLSRRLSETGARVTVGARDLAHAEALCATLPGARAVHCDIAAEESVERLASQLDAVDHIVITASAHHNVPLTEIEQAGVENALRAKVVGPLLVAKHLAPRMSKEGSMIVFSGVIGWKPSPPLTVMGVVNGAVSFLASHLAHELAPIRVNAIAPGVVDSGTWDRLGEDAKSGLLSNAASGTLVGRHGHVDDIVDTALWLLGAGYVSGETIHVDGGSRHA